MHKSLVGELDRDAVMGRGGGVGPVGTGGDPGGVLHEDLAGAVVEQRGPTFVDDDVTGFWSPVRSSSEAGSEV